MSTLPSTNRVRLALIGCGNFARQVHLPNIGLIEQAQLAMVCDIDSTLAQTCAKQFAAEAWCTAVEDIWQDSTITAVIIAVRDDLQASLTAAAMTAGKHVYVEKPVAETPEKIAEVLAMQPDHLHIAVGFHKRFSPLYRQAKTIVQQHGGASTMYVRMCDDAWRWAHGYPPGYLIQHDVCHLFDLVQWLTNSHITQIYTTSSRNEDDLMMVQLANGNVANIISSGNASMDLPKERCEIICDRGAVVVDDFVELRSYGLADAPRRLTVPLRSTSNDPELLQQIQQVAGIEDFSRLRQAMWQEFTATGRCRAIPNFLRDQGWCEALSAWVTGIIAQKPSDHATLHDAWTAAAVAQAAVASRSSGNIVTIAC